MVQSKKFVTPRPLTTGVKTTADLVKQSFPKATAQKRDLPGRSSTGLFNFPEHSNPPQSRQKGIADSYPHFLGYKCALVEALVEEVNLQVCSYIIAVFCNFH